MNKASMLISKIKSNRVVANILKMLTGTALGQIISILMVPVTSRVYGAELYGDLAVFTSAASMCISVAGFGLASAIMVERTDAEAMQTYKLAVNLTNGLVFAAAAIVLMLSPFVRLLKSSLPYGLLIVLLAFYVMTVNRINMLYAWLNRKGKYNVMLFNPIIGPLVNNVLSIGLGLAGFTRFGLYVGLITSQFITLLHMYRNMDAIDYRLRLEDIRPIIRRNRDFILYQYPASFVNSVVSNVPLQVLSLCFGNTVVGYYSMAMKLLSAPTNMIANAMSRVYFKEATDLEHTGGGARAYTLKLCRLVMSAFMLLLLGVLVLGDWAIPLVLGADWAPAVSFLKIMAIWMLFGVSTSCTSGFPSIIGKQKTNMIVALTKLCVFPVAMLGVSRLFSNPNLTLMVYAIACSIINTGYYEALIGSDKALRFKYARMAGMMAVIVAVLYIAMGVLRGRLL